nr:hypothetical protein [Tanacetum cinerariifolium]
TQQVAARDEKWVPFSERVKISSTNIRLETTMPQKKKTSSKKRIKKKVTLFVDDNIIFDDPDAALELGKSISLTEDKEAEAVEAARKVHATHARIVTKPVPEHARRRKSSKVTSDPPKNLKNVLSLTPKEQEVVDTMKSLKKAKRSEEESEYSEEDQLDKEKDDKDGDADDEGDDHISDTQDTDNKDAETESDED